MKPLPTILTSFLLYFLPHALSSSIFAQSSSSYTQSPEERYLQYADSASIHMNAGKFADAKSYLQKALRLMPANPSNPMLFSNLGICQANLGEFGHALQSLEIALVKAPDSPRILLNRAKVLLMLNRDEDAIADLSTILASNPNFTDALLLRAPLYIKASKFKEAATDFSLLHSLLPTDADVTASLAECLAITGDIENADTLYSEAIKENPSAEILQSAAIHYLDTNQLQKADDAIYQALKLDSRNGMMYLLRAILHKKRYQTTEAELDIKLAKEYNIDSQTIEKFFPKKAKK